MTRLLVVSLVLASAGLVLAGAGWLGGRARQERLGFSLLCLFVYAGVLWLRPGSLVASNLAILLVAIGCAPLLGRSLGSFGGIVAFAVTASAVDIVSFGGGLTRHIIQGYRAGTSELLRFLAVTVPVDGRPTPLVGVVDLVIAGALYLGLTAIHGRRRRAALSVLGGLLLAVVTGLAVGGVAAIPFLGSAAAVDAWFAGRDREPHPA